MVSCAALRLSSEYSHKPQVGLIFLRPGNVPSSASRVIFLASAGNCPSHIHLDNPVTPWRCPLEAFPRAYRMQMPPCHTSTRIFCPGPHIAFRQSYECRVARRHRVGRISLQLSLQNTPGNFDANGGKMCFPVLGPQVGAGCGRKVARFADVEYALRINY